MDKFWEFLKTSWHEKTWWRLPVIVLLFLAVVCTAHVSFQSPALTLPQYPLAGLLAGLAAIVGLIAYGQYRSDRPATPVRDTGTEHLGLTTGFVVPDKKKLRIQIVSEGDGMSFWKNGKSGQLRAWLDVSNFQNKTVRIDKLVGDILVNNATVAKFTHHHRITVGPYTYESVHIEADLSPEQIDNIVFQLKQQRDVTTGLSFTAYLHDGDTEPEEHFRIATGNNRFPNFDLPG